MKFYNIYHRATGLIIARHVRTAPWNANLLYIPA